MIKKNQNIVKETSWEMPPINIEDLQAEQRSERKEKIPIVILTLTSFLLTILIGWTTFFFICNNIASRNTNNHPLILGEETEKEEENIQFDPIRQISFISSKNIWVYDLKDGKDIQITNDGGRAYNYTSLAWKNKKELSFSKCSSQNCIIQTYDLYERKSINVFELDAEDIPAMRWSHQGDKLAYLSKKENQLYLTIKSEESSHNIGSFSYDAKKISDFNDALYIRFSPNDEKIMIVNTFVQEGDPSLIVLDLSGEVITSIEKNKGTLPTFGFFTSNETIYYKNHDHLYVRSLENSQETKLTNRVVGAFNFQPSPDKSLITYWTYDWPGGVATIWIYEIGTDSVKRLRDQESYPVWIDNKTLATLQLPNCPRCTKEMFEFDGFAKFDLQTKVISSLLEIDKVEKFSTDNF